MGCMSSSPVVEPKSNAPKSIGKDDRRPSSFMRVPITEQNTKRDLSNGSSNDLNSITAEMPPSPKQGNNVRENFQVRKKNLTTTSPGFESSRGSVEFHTKSEHDEYYLLQIVSELDVLSEFKPAQKQKLVMMLQERTYEAGNRIMQQGDKLKEFIIIQLGEVNECDKVTNSSSVKKAGECFGTLCLFRSSLISNHEIFAKTKVRAWVVVGDLFRNQTWETNQKELEMEINILKTVPIFESMSNSQLQSVVNTMSIISYDDGQYMIKKGDEGTKFFIIKKGQAVVFAGDEEKTAGTIAANKERRKSLTSTANSSELVPITKAAKLQLKDNNELRRLDVKDYFGEIALLQNIARTSNVVANGPCECWVIARDSFRQHLGELSDLLDRNMKRRFLISAPSLKALNESEIETLISVVQLEHYKDGQYVIKQGDVGDKFFIIEKGILRVTKTNNGAEIDLRTMTVTEHFGEQALIKDDVRSANVIAIGDVSCLTIQRAAFVKLLGNLDALREKRRMEDFVNSLSFFGDISLPKAVAQKLVKNATVRDFSEGEIIINVNDPPQSFFIIEEGVVKVYSDYNAESGKFEGPFVGLKKGHFGEQAIIANSPHTKKYVADCKTRCIVLSGEIFMDILRPLLFKLDDLVVEKILGFGGFAVVKKVRVKDSGSTFALKCIIKSRLTETDRKTVTTEKIIFSNISHPFLVRLVTTFQDDRYLYMLQEYIEGGDLRTLCMTQDNNRFIESKAQFLIACVTLALVSLHEKKIIYRDLKPENVLLGKDGYLKLTDFGNAKIINERTFTLCGTPDYMAPEIWLNKGHGFPADNWALGVLAYELLYGETPFESRADEKQSEQIEKIIKAKVNYPKWMSDESVDFMKSLIKVKVASRLGSSKEGTYEITQHPFFRDLDWKGLAERKIKSHFIPSSLYIKQATMDFNDPSVAATGEEDEETLAQPQVWIDGF